MPCVLTVSRLLLLYPTHTPLTAGLQPMLRLRTSTAFNPSPGSLEKPTPVILLPGEGLGPGVFNLWVKSLQVRGYSGVVMSLPSVDDPDALGLAIHTVVEKEQMIPPVLIAHSVGSHAAINYLESHSLAGLILLNPLPVHPSQPASILSTRYADCVASSYQTETEDSAEGVISRYYGVRPPHPVIPTHYHAQNGFPTALLRNLSRHADVNLESGPVPSLVVLSGGDEALYDGKQEKDLLHMWQVGRERERDVVEEEEVHEHDTPIEMTPFSSVITTSQDGMSITEEVPPAFDGQEGEESPHLLRLPYDLSRYGPGNSIARERVMWWMETFT